MKNRKIKKPPPREITDPEMQRHLQITTELRAKYEKAVAELDTAIEARNKYVASKAPVPVGEPEAGFWECPDERNPSAVCLYDLDDDLGEVCVFCGEPGERK